MLQTIGLLLILSLPLESLPLPIRAQVIPLTSLLALFFLPFVLVRKFKVTPVMKMVVILALFIVIQSLFTLFIDISLLDVSMVRIHAWARQIVALLVGIAVYFTLRETLVCISDRSLEVGLMLGAIPALALSLVNVLWGITGNETAGMVVTSVRTSLLPLGLNWPYRVSGLSLEPAHFAFYLAVIVFPVVLARLRRRRKSLALWCFSGLLAIAFVWTFSATGLMILLSMLIAGAVFVSRRRWLFLMIITGTMIGIVVLLLAFPGNYMSMQLGYLLKAESSPSTTNYLYSSFGPFMTALSSYSLWGYGLGGTASHFTEIVPETAQADIALVSWQDMPNLRTLTGRLLAETGFIGLTLASIVIIVAWRQLSLSLRMSHDILRTSLLESARLALVGLIVGHTIAHGSFALPYLWFWLALVDSRYLLSFRNSGVAFQTK